MITWQEFNASQPKENELTFRSFLREYELGEIRKREEVLEEMSIAGRGDWFPNKEMVEYKGANVVKVKWKLVDIFKARTGIELELRCLQNEYIAGRFVKTSEEGDEVFEIFLHMKMTEEKEIAKDFKITKHLLNVDGVKVKESAQGDGIAMLTYKSIIKNQSVIILGDEVQFQGARKLWARLSKEIDVRVDIIDLDSEKVLEKDVVLKHGTDDWDFDKRVWSYDFDKKHIRLILKEIK